MSRLSKLSQYLFGVDKTATLDIFLRSSQRPVEGGAVLWIEPVARIEGQEADLSPFRELRGLLYHEPAVVYAGFESHRRVILQDLYGNARSPARLT